MKYEEERRSGYTRRPHVEAMNSLGGEKVIKTEGGKSLPCPCCGESFMIPARTADELKHIKETKYVVDFRIKRMPEYPFIANMRAVTCPSCNEGFYVKDKYTVVHCGKSDYRLTLKRTSKTKRRRDID
jgi:predicted RNA-binding Zn-ribbon protein involved in translation (DUF1610 family)